MENHPFYPFLSGTLVQGHIKEETAPVSQNTSMFKKEENSVVVSSS